MASDTVTGTGNCSERDGQQRQEGLSSTWPTAKSELGVCRHLSLICASEMSI